MQNGWASRIVLCLLFSALSCSGRAQTYLFAQLSGSPVNTAGWNLQGAASIGNITGTGGSEVVVCPNILWATGAVFFNTPLNLSFCNSWTAEFDFRIYDGSQADGLAFCFLDVPPSGYVVGGGMGIPATANGLKVCFDQNPNCFPLNFAAYPKIEIRWGVGYSECWAQPTADNTTGALSFIRSPSYNHAKIVYNSGNISVYVNNTLYVTGFQQFNFSGYVGFCAGTGAKTDNHSIKNVKIYTNMPPSDAGIYQTVCSGHPLNLGTTANSSYSYSWTPTQGLSDVTASDPSVTISNNTTSNITRKYYVQTAFNSVPGCASTDSVTITVLPSPSLTSTVQKAQICSGNLYTLPSGKNVNASGSYIDTILNHLGCDSVYTAVNLTVDTAAQITVQPANSKVCPGDTTSLTINASHSPIYQWQVNNGSGWTNILDNAIYTGSATDSLVIAGATNSLNNAQYQCLVRGACTSATSSAAVLSVQPPVQVGVSVSSSALSICQGTPVTFTAKSVNGGTSPNYTWQWNGTNTSQAGSTYTNSNLVNGDRITCLITSNATCAEPDTATSPMVTMQVIDSTTASVSIAASATTICAGTMATFWATPVNGGSAPVYEWLINGTKAGTGNEFQNANLANGDTISCVLQSSIVCSALALSSNNPVLEVNPLPQLTMEQDTVIPAGGSIQLSESVIGNISSYQWTPPSGLSDPDVPSPLASPDSSTTYDLQITSSAGCTANGKVTIGVFKKLYMPSAFTPNGDGYNDIFRIPPSAPEKLISFTIYDRWGKMVFQTNDNNIGWDGTINHLAQPVGGYVWEIEYTSALSGKPARASGTVVLLR